ncbi:MAG: AAA family ATPase [Proteobacteria bacterium]|jgi:AAA+ superfamily predicted ATPase|nr:AAA family ATPase [Pseudomonadota bacterium]
MKGDSAESFVREVELHLRARYPHLFIVTDEEERALRLLGVAAERVGMRVSTPRKDARDDAVPPDDGRPVVTVFDDVHRRLDDPALLRRLADMAAGGGDGGVAVVIAPWVDLPPELERTSAVVELPLPSPAELEKELDGVCQEHGVLLTEEDAAALVRVGQGLALAEAGRAFAKALIGWPEDADGARASVERDKRKALHRSRVLEHIEAPDSLDDVGGLDQLKAWLAERRDAFSERARAYGLPAPRGLLLMGVQGCGKSLTAKAVASFWRLPLVRLDLSAVFGQPRPEEALRGAIRVAEAMSPVVLWIDEIEKGFDRDGGGMAARLLGGMVTWLQEKSKEVFVVATANRVADLPPELPRKGRFDEIFFVDLPNARERHEILLVHLARRGLDPAAFDADALVRRTDRFTGSELEQVVIAGMYAAFARGEGVADGDFAAAAAEMVTLYDTFEPEIKALREWARKRARAASTDRRKLDYFGGDGGAGKPAPNGGAH